MLKRLQIFRNPDYRSEFRDTNLYIEIPVLYIQVLGFVVLLFAKLDVRMKAVKIGVFIIFASLRCYNCVIHFVCNHCYLTSTELLRLCLVLNYFEVDLF